MKNDSKIKYEAPTIDVVEVELEQGIAAASITVSGGDDTTPYQPEINDWQDSGFDETQNGDF